MRKFNFVPEGVSGCKVTAWLHESHEASVGQYPAIVICPGGGYNHVSSREAEPVAKPYFEAGYQTFILTYSVGENLKGLAPFYQLAATMAYIRERASEWNIDGDQIAVCGFSAGGHLAAALGVYPIGYLGDFRPNAMILCYPVITADEFSHQGSLKRISGAEIGSAQYKQFGLDQYVDEHTPPTFLWHTAGDSCVPVENSLKFCMALSTAKVPFEYHVFPEGEHGMSVCTEEVGTPCAYNARWVEWSIKWLNKLFGD